MLPQELEPFTNGRYILDEFSCISGPHVHLSLTGAARKGGILKVWYQKGIAVLFVLGALVVPVAGQVQVTSGATRIDLSGRLHLQTATSSCSSFSPGVTDSVCSSDVAGLDMFIRRARLTFDVHLNDWISGKFQPDFGTVDGVEIKDAYGRLNLNPAADNTHAQITMGRFKRPFDAFQMRSSTQTLTIERGIDVAGILDETGLSLDELTTRNRLSDRDIGVMVDGGDANDRFHYWVGVFNGRFGTANESIVAQKQFIGRGQVNLMDGDNPLAIAGAVAFTGTPFTNSDGTLGSRYVGNVEVSAELGDLLVGPHVRAGLVFGKNTLENDSGTSPDLADGDSLADMLTWQVIGSWKTDVGDAYFFEAIEPLFRITMADPNRDLTDDVVYGLTPGVQIFFRGQNKLALNWDFIFLGGDRGSENSFKAQYQFHF